MEFSKVFTVKKEVTEQQFLRNVLISLSKDTESPANIMKAKFGKVVEMQAEFLVMSANVEVNYSGSCGYDRKEEYQTTESKYVREGEYYTCKGVTKRAAYNGSVQVDVIKTRTVTDWSSHSGTIQTDKAVALLNNDKADKQLEHLFPTAFKEAKDESVLEEGVADVNATAYKSAIKECERSATWDVNWPGDHQKNESYNCKSDVQSVMCYIVPCYTVEFEYNGKKYRARGLAIGKINEVHEVPAPDGKAETIEMIEKRRKRRVGEAEKPLKIKKMFVIIAVIMGIIGLYGLININNPNCGAEVCLPLGFSVMAICIIMAILIQKKVDRVVAGINAFANQEKKKLNDIKMNNLIEALKKLNLPALSSSEKNEISKVKRV